jgi:putative transposase
MIRAYRYRLYPTEQQKAELAKTFGCRRYICNYFVREHERAWQEEQKTLSEYDLMHMAVEHKHDKPWLDGADSAMISWAAIGVIQGYRYFFDRVNVRPPREHKKGERPRMSYTTSGSGLRVDQKRNLVFLPKLGAVRAKLHRRFYGELKHATITLNAAGRYYVSLCVDTRDGQVPMKPFDKQTAVGIDVGLRHFLTLSDDTHYEMPDMSRAYDRRAFLQRRLKQQREGSKRYERTRLQIARIHEHITNARLDFHHKTAAKICARYSAIGMETFSAERMREGVGQKKTARDNGFNRKLCHVGLGQFSEILEAKAASTGTYFARIDRWEPSTKRCSACGHVNTDITLDVEEWTCPECGAHHDRDLNAAINIREKSLEIILPLAEGNDKLATPAAANCSSRPRTRKETGIDASQPSTQIDEGTALPRLASMMHYVSSSGVAKIAGTSAPQVDFWAKHQSYFDPKPKQIPLMLRVVEAYRQIGKRLFTFSLCDKTLDDAKQFCHDARKLVCLSHVCEYLGVCSTDYHFIYTLFGTPTINRLMDFLNETLPQMIREECVEILQILEPMQQEIIRKAKEDEERRQAEAIKARDPKVKAQRKKYREYMRQYRAKKKAEEEYDISKNEAMK